MLLIAEAGVIAADVDQLTKFVVGRERPFVHALPLEEKLRTTHPEDNNVSFFSGHTTEAFGCARGRLRHDRRAPAATAGLRSRGASEGVRGGDGVLPDRGRPALPLTDTLVGIVVGVGIGVAVPCLFHGAIDDAPRSSGCERAPPQAARASAARR